ncbi:archaemetzincin [Ereboglobus sp. PH5-5]|nr:archaemetzincin [Ereboglobus sp. PH5-5]
MNIPLRLCVVLALIVLPVKTCGAEFVAPSEEARARALGDVSDESEPFRKLLAADADFEVIAKPGPSDWLSRHKERGQTFPDYKRSNANRPDNARRVIYLFPIGKFEEEASPSLEALREYAAVFFQMEVRVLPVFEPAEELFSPRINKYSGKRQILTGSIMAFLRELLPKDAYCMIGVTMTDLYPQASWNFVFGQASLRERVGVFSFARHDPAFLGIGMTGRPADFGKRMLWRSCHTLAHEIAHMFGLWHCVYYQCLINGSNTLAEADRQPQHACIICLRKLREVIRFDPVKRYRKLEAVYRKHDMTDEAEWVKRQLAKVK